MKANKKVKEKLVKNLIDFQERLNKNISFYIDKIKEAESVEDIMSYKKELLKTIINNIPFGHNHCYFCIAKDFEIFDMCLFCPYAYFHKDCLSEHSDYTKIKNAQDKLLFCIEQLYYKNENYDKIKYDLKTLIKFENC